MNNGHFWGYRRANGRVGARNHVIILPVDDISNRTAEAVAANVPGTLPLPHAYGRLQFGADLELFFRTLIGIGSNPNVAAAVVIGIEPRWSERIAQGIAKTGKPVETFSIEGHGDLETTAKAARAAARLLQDASELRREKAPLSELWVSAKCGESDTTTGLASCPTVGRFFERLIEQGGTAFFGETSELTGGEHLVAERMKTPQLREKFMTMFRDYAEMIERTGDDLLGSQPTEGNIAGGLSTIEEKALGNIEKIGRLKVDGVLSPAETPAHKGLHFMDTSSAAAECVTLFAAAGAAVHLFPTGQGNVIGNPVLPVVKLSGNPKTVSTMSEHIDVDVSQLLRGEMNLDQAADRLSDITLRAACGRLTCAEVLGHREFVLTKLHRSA
jgi:(2R)-sulfolactate sulfo-lyase subunit beta